MCEQNHIRKTELQEVYLKPQLYKQILTTCLLMTLIFLVPAAGSAQTRFEKYWTVDEYLRKYPEQAAKTSAFHALVRASSSGRPVVKSPVKIGVIYPGLQASDYWRRSVSSMEARLKEIVPDYELLSHFTRPGTAIAEQAEKIGRFLQQKVDYLIFTLNASRHKALIQKIMSRGDVKLLLQNITTPLKSFSRKQPLQYVGFDHAIGTEILIQEYLERTEGVGEYAILYGPRGYVNDMRGGTFLDAMKKYPALELKASYYVGFNREKSFVAAMDLLKNHPDLKFIFSSSTDIALGVIDALKHSGKLGQVMTNGWGGGDAELKAIERGELDFTVMRMNDDNGVAMAETIYLDQLGKGNDIPVIFSGDILLVSRDMSQKDIGELKKRAFRYSQ